MQVVKAYTLTSEFFKWIKYFEEKDKRPHRSDYYLASIATEVRRSYSKKPRSIRLEQLLLKFETKEGQESKVETKEFEEHKRNQLELAKAAWRARAKTKETNNGK